MKTVELFRAFDYVPDRRISIHFQGGFIYRRVIEAATVAIVAAGAGRVVPLAEHETAHATGFPIVDCRHVWQRRR